MPTSGRILIERGTTNDIEDIADTYVDSARHHRGLCEVPSVEDVARGLAPTLDGPDHATFVALMEGTVVGSVDVHLARP